MLRVTDQYFWSFVFSLFYLFLLIMGAIILHTETRIPFAELTLIDFTLVTLATWRLTRLFVYDSVTRFVREQFLDVVKVGRGYRLEKPKNGPRRVLNELFSCPWCFGVWAATFVVFFYLITPYAYFPVLLLAVAAVGTFLQLVANLVGHQAARLKDENAG